VIAGAPSVIEHVAGALPKNFPAKQFEAVTAGLLNSAKQLARMPPK